MWLPDGEPVPDHATFARFRKRCAKEIEDLFYQYARLPEKQGETDHETVFIDGFSKRRNGSTGRSTPLLLTIMVAVAAS